MSISNLISVAGERLTPTERGIATAVLAEPTLLAFGTVSELADRVGTSRPSIVRFGRQLGFEGYADLQGQVRQGLSKQLSRPSERIRHPEGSLAIARAALEDALAGVFVALDAERLAELAHPVARAGSVWILTGETSRAGAHALRSGLTMIRPYVHLVEEHSSGRDLGSAGEDDVALVFDFARYRRHCVTAAQTLAAHGVTIVAVTDGPLSPLAALTDLWCEVRVPGVGPFDSSVPAVAAAELLVAHVASELEDEARERIDRTRPCGRRRGRSWSSSTSGTPTPRRGRGALPGTLLSPSPILHGRPQITSVRNDRPLRESSAMISELRTLSPLFVVLLPVSMSETETIDRGPQAGTQSANLELPADLAPRQAASWLRKVKREIARREYFWSTTADGGYTAPNRLHRLRCKVGSDGIEIVPRKGDAAGSEPAWKLRLETVGFGYEDALRPVQKPWIETCENQVELHSEGLIEWFLNDERGIEQGWTIPARPPGSSGRRLRIELALTGLHPRIADDLRSAALVDDAGTLRLRYHGLRAWDASGRELSTKMSLTESGLAVAVSDRGALYPVTVDPFLSGPVWTAESGVAVALFGWSVSGAGDVNGDGFDDVIVGAPWLNVDGSGPDGRAFLFLGSSNGPSLLPDWMAHSGQVGARFGTSVSGAGDVNGDGFDDVIVGAPQFDNGEEDEGRAYLYFGSASGLSLTPDWTTESDQEDARFGSSLSGAGDVNGDGYDDVLVGALGFDAGTKDVVAFLYLGSTSGPSVAPDWTAEGYYMHAYSGSNVAGAGDVNGDGFDDLVVGVFAYEDFTYEIYGRALLYLGSASGPPLEPDWQDRKYQPEPGYGFSVSGAGDVNGDGFDDLIVGANLFNSGQEDEGRAFLYLGSACGPSLNQDWSTDGDQEFGEFGFSVSGAGDVNGDGFDDLIVGAPRFDDGQVDEGRAFLYLGSVAGPSLAPGWMAESDQMGAHFGASVSGAGDVNGDGLDDVIVGAPHFDDVPTDEGWAFLYYGLDFVDCNGNGVHDDDDIASGTSNDGNGNGVPDECETIGAIYCAANSNSTGSPANLSASGSASSAQGNLTLEARPVPNRAGIFFHGGQQIQVSFGNGFLCVGGGLQRGQVVLGACNSAGYAYDNSTPRQDLSAYIGTNRNFQYWHRDPMGGGAHFNTSFAVSIGILP